MSYLGQPVYDWGLACITGSGNRLYLSSASASVWADVVSGSTGSAVITSGSPGPGDGANGRMVVIPASSGSFWAGTTTGCWVLANAASSSVLASGSLSGSQATTIGNTWTLTAFNIRIPAPA